MNVFNNYIKTYAHGEKDPPIKNQTKAPKKPRAEWGDWRWPI